MDTKGEIHRNIVIVRDFNTPLTSMDRSSRQKINKEIMALSDTLDQMYFIDIFRAFHSKAAEYTYFSSAQGTFSRIDHMSGHKASLNSFKKTEIISSILLDHSAMKLEISHKKNKGKHTKTWKLNNMLLNNEWGNNEIKEEIKIYLEINENQNTKSQNPWDNGKVILRGKFIALQANLNKQDKPK